MTAEPVTFARLLATHGAERGDQPVVTVGGESITYARFDTETERYAHYLADLGVSEGSFVTIAEPNSIEFFLACGACWKLAAIPQPVSARLPRLELEAIVKLARSAVVVGAEVEGFTSLPTGFRAPEDYEPPAPLAQRLGRGPDQVVSPAWKAPTSGGSTGRPKLIVSGDPSIFTPNMAGLASVLGCAPGETMVMPGPLYHNGPFIWSMFTVLSGGHVELLKRFDAEATLAAVEQTGASAIYLVPTMMQRIWKLDDEIKFSYDLSSLRTAFHLAEPCPKWLKEEWINWLGPEVIFELYGGTEGMMFTVINGADWLQHPGSVGQALFGEFVVTDEEGNPVPAGTEGEIWMRPTGRDKPTYTYLGDEPADRDGWQSLGDMGWVDEDGFLYLGDRRKDMVLIGGANVYPAEVEAAIAAHPDVLSTVVIGLADEDKGNRIHAIVQPRPEAKLSEDQLMAFLAQRLVAYKLPRTIEWATEPLRDDAGKVRRNALATERAKV